MSWQEVWQRKGNTTIPPAEITLGDLLKISGFDVGAGEMNTTVWREYVGLIQTQLDISADSRLLEVGCGGGAFLYPLAEQGIAVSGIDYADTSIAVARQMMPQGDFRVGEARIGRNLPPRPTLACRVRPCPRR